MPTEKEIIIPTNYNHKLDCDRFCHIQSAATTGIPESTVITIKTKDQSHPPVKAIVCDSVRQKLSELSAAFIYLSHGMDPLDFKLLLKKADPQINPETEMAIYFYKKIAV